MKDKNLHTFFKELQQNKVTKNIKEQYLTNAMHWIESSQNSFVEVPTPKVYLGDGTSGDNYD